MPVYEYKCTACEHVFEKLQRFSDPPLKTCEKCGGPVRKLISQSSFILKGSGWYVTDYARKENGGKSAASTEKAAASGKDSSSGSESGTKAESTGAEHKSDGSSKKDSSAGTQSKGAGDGGKGNKSASTVAA